MNLGDFFTFRSKLVSTTVQAHPVGLRTADQTHSVADELRLISGDYNSILFPVTFRQEFGKELRDVLDTGWAGLYLISENVKTIFEEQELTGWKTFPIRLLDKKNNEISGYKGFSITGRCGPIDVSKSEIIQKRLVPNGPLCKYYRGLYVGLDQWDGSDLFLPPSNRTTIITARTAKVIRSNKLTNIRLTNLMDIEIDEMTAELIRSKS